MAFNFQLNNVITYRDQRLQGPRLWRGLLLFMLVCGFGAVANVGIAQVLYEQHAAWTVAGGDRRGDRRGVELRGLGDAGLARAVSRRTRRKRRHEPIGWAARSVMAGHVRLRANIKCPSRNLHLCHGRARPGHPRLVVPNQPKSWMAGTSPIAIRIRGVWSNGFCLTVMAGRVPAIFAPPLKRRWPGHARP